MKTIRFKAGKVIFKEGDRSIEAYRILKGKVHITISNVSKPVILAQLGEGDIFGEMGMVDDRPRTAAAHCVADTECELMTRTDFQAAILENPKRLLPYLATFFERLRTVTSLLNLELQLRAQAAAARSGQPLSSTRSKSKISTPIPASHHPERTRVHHMHASSLLSSGVAPEVEMISLSPLNPLCASKFDKDFGNQEIEKFPFRIGRVNDEDGSVFSSNDFSIRDRQPFQVSKNHCSIEREGDNYFVRDRGSTLGTIVNDIHIGVHHGTLTVDLKQGENILIVGSQRSPYKFRVVLA
jgi:CRP/FNR family cyclic AMP-dependent transcriptional regulator